MKNLIYLLTFILMTVSCNFKNKPQGGQDSGGGDTTKSTMEDVELNYQRAQGTAAKIFHSFFFGLEFFETGKHQLIDIAKNRIQDRTKSSIPDADEENSEDALLLKDSTYLMRAIKELLKSSPINIVKDKSCQSVDKKHASASIKKLEYKSEICFSFYKLLDVPKDSLHKEILGLLLHEYMHALGFNEKDSTQIQKMFTDNFKTLELAYLTGQRAEYQNMQDSPMFLINAANNGLMNLMEDRELNSEFSEEDKRGACKDLYAISILSEIVFDEIMKSLRGLKYEMIKDKLLTEDSYFKFYDDTSLIVDNLYIDARRLEKEICDNGNSVFDEKNRYEIRKIYLDSTQFVEKIRAVEKKIFLAK